MVNLNTTKGLQLNKFQNGPWNILAWNHIQFDEGKALDHGSLEVIKDWHVTAGCFSVNHQTSLSVIWSDYLHQKMCILLSVCQFFRLQVAGFCQAGGLQCLCAHKLFTARSEDECASSRGAIYLKGKQHYSGAERGAIVLYLKAHFKMLMQSTWLCKQLIRHL